MIKTVSRTEEIKARLKEDEKVSYFDSKEDIQYILDMNEEMENIRREYYKRDRNSQISAAGVILTA